MPNFKESNPLMLKPQTLLYKNKHFFKLLYTLGFVSFHKEQHALHAHVRRIRAGTIEFIEASLGL